jgi:hypothetical protein
MLFVNNGLLVQFNNPFLYIYKQMRPSGEYLRIVALPWVEVG